MVLSQGSMHRALQMGNTEHSKSEKNKAALKTAAYVALAAACACIFFGAVLFSEVIRIPAERHIELGAR
jgi:geranylgeranyl pyrophosphate synthase